MDVHDKSTEKSESETLSALLSQNCTDSYHIKVNISNSTAKKLFDSHSNLALICPSVHRSFSMHWYVDACWNIGSVTPGKHQNNGSDLL
jgi:hypothetical protein